jgi:hypothetical protein
MISDSAKVVSMLRDFYAYQLDRAAQQPPALGVAA